jgi:hypothetical protein
VAQLIGDPSASELAQPLRRDERARDVPAQSFDPFAVLGTLRDARMKTEALHSGPVFSREGLDVFHVDSVAEPHDWLSRASTSGGLS